MKRLSSRKAQWAQELSTPVQGHFPSQTSQQRVPTRPALVACVRGYQSCEGTAPPKPTVHTTKSFERSSSAAITTTLYLGFDKTRGLIARKCSWPSLQKDVETNVKGYDAVSIPKRGGTSPTGILSCCRHQLIVTKTSR